MSPPESHPSRLRRLLVLAAAALFGLVVVAVAAFVSHREAAHLRGANRRAAERAGRLSGIGAEPVLRAATSTERCAA